jgi:hypothetical protein
LLEEEEERREVTLVVVSRDRECPTARGHLSDQETILGSVEVLEAA